MRKWLLFLVLLSYGSYAQDSTQVVHYLDKSVWRVEFFGPGVINESRLGKNTTFVSQFRFIANGAYEKNSSIGGGNESRSAIKVYPQLSGAGRYYYNFVRRLERGKSIRYNSGNYISTKLLYTLPAIIETSSGGLQAPDVQGVSVQALWGFQRTYRRNFYLNLELGLGVNTYSSEPLGGAAYFTLGYTFPKRS